MIQWLSAILGTLLLVVVVAAVYLANFLTEEDQWL